MALDFARVSQVHITFINTVVHFQFTQILSGWFRYTGKAPQFCNFLSILLVLTMLFESASIRPVKLFVSSLRFNQK